MHCMYYSIYGIYSTLGIAHLCTLPHPREKYSLTLDIAVRMPAVCAFIAFCECKMFCSFMLFFMCVCVFCGCCFCVHIGLCRVFMRAQIFPLTEHKNVHSHTNSKKNITHHKSVLFFCSDELCHNARTACCGVRHYTFNYGYLASYAVSILPHTINHNSMCRAAYTRGTRQLKLTSYTFLPCSALYAYGYRVYPEIEVPAGMWQLSQQRSLRGKFKAK